jgi:hypothetical protein
MTDDNDLAMFDFERTNGRYSTLIAARLVTRAGRMMVVLSTSGTTIMAAGSSKAKNRGFIASRLPAGELRRSWTSPASKAPETWVVR